MLFEQVIASMEQQLFSGGGAHATDDTKGLQLYYPNHCSSDEWSSLAAKQPYHSGYEEEYHPSLQWRRAVFFSKALVPDKGGGGGGRGAFPGSGQHTIIVGGQQRQQEQGMRRRATEDEKLRPDTVRLV